MNTHEIKELALMMIIIMLSVSAVCASSNSITIDRAGAVISVCAWVLMLVLGITTLLFMVVSAAEYVCKTVQPIFCGSTQKKRKQASDMEVIA